ncbi:MAG TPA: DNA recombination protein RmuC [Gaiellaceae bacterium]|nr:DNA recombination protein RmuC [Gaiellaceae bacterium]
MQTALLIAVLVVVLAAALLWLARMLRSELAALRVDSGSQLAERSSEVDRRLLALQQTMDRRLAELDTKVDRRLETASQTTAKIHERLGEVGASTSEMLERAKDLARLEQALRPPKARGGFGELLLENLLRDRLPPAAFELQYGFSGGERVDAVVRVGQLIPVDSKFPLDNFSRLVETEDDSERQLYEKAFARDVKGHIDAIAAKYIRPAEGTYDFAFMYVPVEAVYYELACGKTGQLLQHAHAKRVFPVSPTTFVAYLQVIVLGMRGMQIEQHAHEVMGYVAALQQDFSRFKDDFDVLGKHLGNAQAKFAEADKRLDKFETKLERAAEQEPQELAAVPAQQELLPPAADAA